MGVGVGWGLTARGTGPDGGIVTSKGDIFPHVLLSVPLLNRGPLEEEQLVSP